MTCATDITRLTTIAAAAIAVCAAPAASAYSLAPCVRDTGARRRGAARQLALGNQA